MKAICSIALILIVCAQAGAADAADPVGTWKCEYNIGTADAPAKRTSALTITKAGDALTGKMDWPDQKDVKLKDVKFKDGTLTFGAERLVQGTTYDLEYKLTITGDSLKGKGSLDMGGKKQEFDFEGKREKKEK
jgi:opacity protein-like surface antigen